MPENLTPYIPGLEPENDIKNTEDNPEIIKIPNETENVTAEYDIRDHCSQCEVWGGMGCPLHRTE
jgi:hypothetical protein